MKRLEGVTDAKVNFPAAKVTIYGKASLEEMRASSTDNLTFYEDRISAKAVETLPFYKDWTNLKFILALILLLISFTLKLQLGEDHILPILAYIATIILGGYSLFINGFKNLIRLDFDMTTLMTIAILGAAAIGEWGEGAVVVILFALSETLEKYSMNQARQSLASLIDLAPSQATLLVNGQEVIKTIEEIQVGDTILVRPGEKIPLDGYVTAGLSTVNQAAITGESMPMAKGLNDEVYAGTLNEEGLLEIYVTAGQEDSTLAKIIHLVEEAQADKAPTQQFVDRFAKYYTPVIMILAFLIIIIPPLTLGADWGAWFYRGLTILVVGCPCALVISTPIAIVTAIGNAARRGVLIKGGMHLEKAGAIDTIAFDKTGTLTKGQTRVSNIIYLPAYLESDQYELQEKLIAEGQTKSESIYFDLIENNLASYSWNHNTGENAASSNYLQEIKNHLGLAAALEKSSNHPLAKAILAIAEHLQVDYQAYEVNNFQSLTARGLRGQINGQDYFIGSPALLVEEDLTANLSPIEREKLKDLIQAQEQEGQTVITLSQENKPLLLLAIADTVRPSSGPIIQKLAKLGIKETVMLTGDNQTTAQAVASSIGITSYYANLLPADKMDKIKELQASGAQVAMVGDGVNDAPALALADIGIAMGGIGTDTAIETADITLMADDLDQLPYTIALSRKALSIIKQNISFSIAIKFFALVMVLPGWLTLWLAVFADMGATIIVTLNSLRLIRISDGR